MLKRFLFIGVYCLEITLSLNFTITLSTAKCSKALQNLAYALFSLYPYGQEMKEIYNQCMGFKFFVCCQNCTIGWTEQIYLKLVN